MNSFAKEGQDIFARLFTDTDSGFYLDIGMGDPFSGNNTIALERLGWRGLMFDQNGNDVAHANQERRNVAIQCDARRFEWRKELAARDVPRVIDFISLDVDEANVDVILQFPFDTYEFKTLTFEHDRYNSGDVRKRACEAVLSRYPQYCRVLNNGTVQGLEWEDWWVNFNFLPSGMTDWPRAESIPWEDYIEMCRRAVEARNSGK